MPAGPGRWPLDGPEACIVESRPVEARGGAAIVAFPGRGLAATLAAAYLAEALKMQAVGRLDGSALPSVAIVEAGEVVHPVRLLLAPARKGAKAAPVVLVLSELPLDDEAVRPVAAAILEWCKAKGIQTIVSSESVALEEQDDPFEAIQLWGVSNRPALNKRLAKAKLPVAKEGVVAGVTGALLDQGLDSGLDVVALVAVGQGMEPDVRTASTLVGFLARFLGLPVKMDKLKREADRFERHLRDIERRRRASQPHGSAGPQEFV